MCVCVPTCPLVRWLRVSTFLRSRVSVPPSSHSPPLRLPRPPESSLAGAGLVTGTGGDVPRVHGRCNGHVPDRSLGKGQDLFCIFRTSWT